MLGEVILSKLLMSLTEMVSTLKKYFAPLGRKRFHFTVLIPFQKGIYVSKTNRMSQKLSNFRKMTKILSVSVSV